MKPLVVSIFILLLFSSSFVQAQNQDSVLIQIETTDGNTFLGHIIVEDDNQIVLKTASLGEISIKKVDIKSKREVKQSQVKEGKLWFANPQSTRYFWAPNSYGLKKGEGNYQNIYVLWNQFSYGITDNFSIGAGIVPLFLFGGEPTPVFITPKISIPIKKDKINLGGGALLGAVLGDDAGAFGLVYGLSTFGTPDNNISVSFAYGFADGDWADSPLINVSALLRLSSRAYFITENYYLNIDGDGGGVITVGGRWIIKKASLDFMLAMPFGTDSDSFIAIPVVGFSIPFGKK